MHLWPLSTIAIALPILWMLIATPPKTRAGYLFYSVVFGVLASWLIVGFFSLDVVLRAQLKEADRLSDLVISSVSQISVAITAMLLGGLSTNLLVAGLSLPWRDRTAADREKESREEFACELLESFTESTKEQLALLPEKARFDYLHEKMQSHVVRQLFEQVSVARQKAFISKFKSLVPRREFFDPS